MNSITLVDWNVNRRSTTTLQYLDSLPMAPDVVCMQEVTNNQAEKYAKRLSDLGLVHFYFSGVPTSQNKRYGNVIASVWPVNPSELPASPLLKWPQLIAHVKLETPWGGIALINAHIPNGSMNGWAKIDTFDYLADLVLKRKHNPLILTGDFNEPQYVLQNNRIVTWGQKLRPNGRYETNGIHRGQERVRWDKSVRWYFEGESEHGLRHAFWSSIGGVKLEPTHISRQLPRWFDHAFVSSEFEVIECTYDHTVRMAKKLSDHSALLLQLDYHPD